MLKVLKAKMFRMIKKLTDRFLITTRWRHLVDYFEISHLSLIYRVVPNILANLPHLQGCAKHSSQFAPSTGMCQTFQPLSLIYRAVTYILANLLHPQDCAQHFSQLTSSTGCAKHSTNILHPQGCNIHFSQYPSSTGLYQTF